MPPHSQPIFASISALLTFSLIAITASFSPRLQAADDDTSLEALPLPEVLTPVRLKQPRTEVPASVTVIDHELIEASGIRELPELLRLVPGMAVGARSGWDYVASYHGTNRHNSHRMQVMIDGRSVYQASLATIDWDDIPLAMEDIERIEVTRGPDTAAYGANAFLGIINIITKHPDDSPRLRMKATAGSKSAEDYYLSTSATTSAGSYRVSAAARRDTGFDEKASGVDRRDTKSLQFVTARWLTAPAESWNLDMQMGYKSGKKTEDFGKADITPPDQSIDNYFASINSQHFLSTNNSLKWQLDFSGTANTSEYRTCSTLETLRPALKNTVYGLVPICGDVNQNIRTSRADLDIQDTWLSGGPWKLVAGAHAQYQYVDSDTYYSGAAERTTYQLFGNFEYRFLPQWSATIAGSQEYLDSGSQAFSPRLALLYFPSENHTIRLVYSEAIRTPDLFESQSRWHYRATNVAPAIPVPFPLPTTADLETYYSPQNQRNERIRSRELGYYGLWFERRLETDIKFFNDDMDDLITDNPNYGNYFPVNESSVKQRGVETEINLRATDSLRLRVTAALIDSNASSIDPSQAFHEEDLTPHKSGSAAIIYDLPANWQWSSFYYFAYPINEQKVSRIDSRLAKQFAVYSSRLTLSATLQHYLQGRTDFLVNNVYDDENRIYLSVDLSF